MKIDLQGHAQTLRRAVNDYYEQRLSFAAYRAERSAILDRIEDELLRKNDGAAPEEAAQKA